MWPSDARPRVTPVSLWTGSLGIAADYRFWGSLAHVHTPGANKLSAHTNLPPSHFFTTEPPPVALVAPSPSRPAPSGVSHITPQSSPPQHPVSVVSGGVGGAAAGGEGIGAAGASGSGSGGAGGVGVEAPSVEDTVASSRRPRPTSPSGFPSVPQFPPRSPPRPVTADSGGVPAGGTGGPRGVVGGGSGFGGAGAGGAGTSAPTSRTVRFLTREQRLLCLEREEREHFETAHQQQQQQSQLELQERVEDESQPYQERVEEKSQPQHQRLEEESRPQQQLQWQPQQESVEEEPRLQQQVQLQTPQETLEEEPHVEQQEQQQGQVPLQQTPMEAEQQRLRDLPNPAPARLSPVGLVTMQMARFTLFSTLVFLLLQSCCVSRAPVECVTGGSGGAGAGGNGVVGTGDTGAASAGAEGAGAEDAGAGGAGAGGTGGTAAGGAGAGGTEAGGPGVGGTGARGTGAGGTGAGGTGAGGTGAGGTGAGGTGAVGTGAGGSSAGGVAQPLQRRPFFWQQPRSSLSPPGSALRQVLSFPSSTGTTPPLLCPSPDLSQSHLRPDSPLPAPAPYTKLTGSLAERREPKSRPASLCVVLPSPPASSPPYVPIPESDLARAASLTVTRCLATLVTDTTFESAAASALVAELVDFGATYCLDYFASLTAMDADMASCKSTGTYVDAVPPPWANIMTTLRVLLHVATQRDYELHSLDFSTAFLQGSLHEEIWLRRPPGFIKSFSKGTQTTLAALGFAPSTVDPSLFLRTDPSLPPFYIPVCVDDLVIATADNEVLTLVKAELQKRHTCTDLGDLHSYLGLHITWDRAALTITLTQSHIVQQVLQHFRFWFSSPQPTPLPTGHSLSAPPLDESVAPSSLVLCYLCSTSGMGLVPGGRSRVVLTGHSDACWADDQETRRSSHGYTFSLGAGSVLWRSTRSSSVLSSSCEPEIYTRAMAAQELRCLTYLLTDLGERPLSAPVLYINNEAMIALCREQRLEQRSKHISPRNFLARELQQRGHLRLAYVASQTNTAEIFTKALGSGDHQRFYTARACAYSASLALYCFCYCRIVLAIRPTGKKVPRDF
ncbi:unnamed protein product [Closterium sp. NIES-54]